MQEDEITPIFNQDDLNKKVEDVIFEFTKNMEDALKAGAIFSAIKTVKTNPYQLPTTTLEIIINDVIMKQYSEITNKEKK